MLDLRQPSIRKINGLGHAHIQMLSVKWNRSCFCRPRKLLRNVLLAHAGLDILMDVLENQTTDDELFSHAVLSVKILSEHVGVVSPGESF